MASNWKPQTKTHLMRSHTLMKTNGTISSCRKRLHSWLTYQNKPGQNSICLLWSYLGAEHGAANQEALSLEWSDINFDFDGQGIIKLYRTKNKYERTEFMMPRTRKALLDWKGHLEFKRRKCNIEVIDQDIVFCRLDGTPIIGFRSAWKTICQIAGLPNFHYHDLRHTFASNLLLSGSGIKDVKEMMGHKDISMTDRYAHINLQHRNRRQKQLAIHYDNGVR